MRSRAGGVGVREGLWIGVLEVGGTSGAGGALLRGPASLGVSEADGTPRGSESPALATHAPSLFETFAEFPGRGRAGSPGPRRDGAVQAGGRRRRGLGAAAGRWVTEAGAGGTRPADRVAGGGPRAPGRGCILGPLAQPPRRLTHPTGHTETVPPRQAARAAHACSAPPRLTHAPSPPRAQPLPVAAAPRVDPSRRPHTRPSTRRSPEQHPAHTPLPLPRSPVTHSSCPSPRAQPSTHTRPTRSLPGSLSPLPAAAPAGSGRCLWGRPFPGRANKRLPLPARPKKGRLSGVRGGRGGPARSPTLRPCPTWRPRGGAAKPTLPGDSGEALFASTPASSAAHRQKPYPRLSARPSSRLCPAPPPSS